MRNKWISLLFCLLLFGGAALHFLSADRYYSEQEKRTLRQFPELTEKSFFSGKFGNEFESYLADQFPGRDGWVTVKTVTERALGKRESGGVYFADDHYLIEIHRSFSETQTAANLDAVKTLQDALAQEGIPLSLMLVPTASQILSDKLPPYAPNADQQAVIELAREKGLNVTDVTEALSARREEYIYYRTDHHWTSLGAYYAWAAWQTARGRTPDPVSAWTVETLCENFLGTTYAKTGDPFAVCDTIEAWYKEEAHAVNYNDGYELAESLYARKYLEGSDQYAVFLNSNQSVTVVEGGGEGRLLILKDSYANCFAQFCVDDFEETHLIDLRFFRSSVKKYIAAHGITEVLVLYNIPNFTAETTVGRCVR